MGTPWLLWTMLYGQTSLHFFRIGFEIGKQREWREGSGKITFRLNHNDVEVQVERNWTLLYVLREILT